VIASRKKNLTSARCKSSSNLILCMADVSGWMKVDGERDNDDVDGDSDNGDSEVIDARDNPLPLNEKKKIVSSTLFSANLSKMRKSAAKMLAPKLER
jgi:hypothetical protein